MIIEGPNDSLVSYRKLEYTPEDSLHVPPPFYKNFRVSLC